MMTEQGLKEDVPLKDQMKYPSTVWLVKTDHIRVFAWRAYCKPVNTHHPALAGFSIGGGKPGEPYVTYTVVAECSTTALDGTKSWIPIKKRRRILALLAQRLVELYVAS